MIESNKPSSEKKFEILEFPFSAKAIATFNNYDWATDFWPIVYIISQKNTNRSGGTIYIGESINAVSRLSTHLKNDKKKKLSSLQVISSKLFNKSATLDIESSLISHFSGEGNYQILNAVAGITSHSYYQRSIYNSLFDSIWNELEKKEIINKSRVDIENSDLFKYSPYKSLTPDQHEAIQQTLSMLLKDQNTSVVINGSAGTGKTIIAIYLIRYLLTDLELLRHEIEEGIIKDNHQKLFKIRKKYPTLQIALVVPMASLRKTLKQVFKVIPGLRANMVIGPYDVKKKDYDILLVDEAHRLTRFKDLGQQVRNFKDTNKILDLPEGSVQIEWVLKQAKHSIFFYDQEQSIRPADIRRKDFEKLESRSSLISLTSQLRVKGGADYIKFIGQLLKGEKITAKKLDPQKYEFKLYRSLRNLRNDLFDREKKFKLARLMAGYNWTWSSKEDKSQVDINIEGLGLQWNMEPYGWINSNSAINEVGCIHTTQGYDLNYAGIIIGPDLSYDPDTKTVIICPEHYKDTSKVGELKRSGLTKDREELKRYIINIYKVLMSRGILGSFIYVCDPYLRQYFAQHIPLAEDWEQETPSILRLQPHEAKPYINSVPLFDLAAAAGGFGAIQSPEEIDWIPLPPSITPSEDLFACQVVGNSMSRIIPNESVCLFRKYQGGSRGGKVLLVELNEFIDQDAGSAYTIKEYWSRKVVSETGFKHEEIRLKPDSLEEFYEDIVVTPSMAEGLRVIGEFVVVLGIS